MASIPPAHAFIYECVLLVLLEVPSFLQNLVILKDNTDWIQLQRETSQDVETKEQNSLKRLSFFIITFVNSISLSFS
jgi:hypothetical protein